MFTVIIKGRTVIQRATREGDEDIKGATIYNTEAEAFKARDDFFVARGFHSELGKENKGE